MKPKQFRHFAFVVTPEAMKGIYGIVENETKEGKTIKEHDLVRNFIVQGIKEYWNTKINLNAVKQQLEARNRWETEHPIGTKLEKLFARFKAGK